VTSNRRYSIAAERTLRLFYPELRRQAFGYSTLLMTLEEGLAPPRLVVIRGPHSELDAWRNFIRKQYHPTTLTFFLPPDVAGLPEVLAKPVKDHVNAWVCRDVSCLPPVSTIARLEIVLQSEGME